jgi:hypothetical protein
VGLVPEGQRWEINLLSQQLFPTNAVPSRVARQPRGGCVAAGLVVG